jgi:predicted RNA-binding Zn ribbon-like protein
MSEQIRLDAGRVCLDFMATLGAGRDERLPDPAALDRWLGAAGLPAVRPADAGALERARTLRAALFALVDAELAGDDPSATAVEVVNAAAAAAPAAARLTVDGGRIRVAAVRRDADAAMAGIARDAIELFGGPDRALLRACAAPDCSGVFLDTSRGRTRRWCSSARCGNRARVAAHRVRRSREG